MALADGSGSLTAADVAAVMNGGNGGRGFGGWGGDGAWWMMILFLYAFSNNGWGGNGNIQGDLQRGFDQQALTSQISGLNSQVSNGFADAAVARCNAQTTLLQAMNANQNAVNQGMNALAMSLQQCCCDNRQTFSDGMRDLMAQNNQNTQAIVQSQTQGFQGILDKLCQMEINDLKSQNEQLRSQLTLASLAASQTAQTAALMQDNNAQTAALIQRIAPAPIPAYQVQNPNCCGNINSSYGCSSGCA